MDTEEWEENLPRTIVAIAPSDFNAEKYMFLNIITLKEILAYVIQRYVI